MSSTTTARIEAWFAEHDGDGEFTYQAILPFQVLSPASPAAPVIITTKPTPCLLAATERADCAGMGVIAQYGLPSENDLRWIAEFSPSNELLYLGDMDPVDLLIFAWLRSKLNRRGIAYLGISDAYLRGLDVKLPDSFLLDCSQSEKSCLSFLSEVLSDLREIVGPCCHAILQRGQKIEIEAVVSAKGNPESILGGSP